MRPLIVGLFLLSIVCYSCCHSAGVGPILEDPIPSTAQPSDQCTAQHSCDDCPSTSYCRYSDNGQPTCCTSLPPIARPLPARDGTVPPIHPAHYVGHATVGPITEEAKPKWSSNDDVCLDVSSCDTCTSQQYCQYTTNGQSQCCSPSSPLRPASVTPISDNPTPKWASQNDICQPIASCDDCDSSSYCQYSSNGQAACCNSVDDINAFHRASVGPIETDIPTGATAHDNCRSVFTCDECDINGNNNYCFYLSQDEGRCCELPKTDLSAKHYPIPFNPTQQLHWTHSTAPDSCSTIRSCDDCAADTYCKYLANGESQCCSRPKFPAQQQDDQLSKQYLTGSTKPIQDNPIPEGASLADQCDTKQSCDDCTGNQYCKYTPTGRPLCCTLESDNQQSTTLGASVTPVTQNPIPDWASSTDICLMLRSCDDCTGDERYCKYTNDGKPQCCVRNQ